MPGCGLAVMPSTVVFHPFLSISGMSYCINVPQRIQRLPQLAWIEVKEPGVSQWHCGHYGGEESLMELASRNDISTRRLAFISPQRGQR